MDASQREGDEEAAPKARVLVVDDTVQNLELMSAILRSVPDLEIVLCDSADDAARALDANPDFAVALLDVYMPEVSGFELAKRMRADERLRSLPIIFVTAAMPTAQIMFEGYDHGAVDILFKPLAPRIVKSKVEVFKLLYLARKDLEASNERLREAQNTAEKAGRLKDRFLANISHEIRTPIQAILGLADCVRGEPSAQVREAFLRDIIENAEYLSRLVGNILDVSKLKSGMVEASKATPFSIEDVGSFLRGMFGEKAAGKGLTLTFEIAQNASGAIFRGDELRLKQILCNLVGNAIKFTPTGGVHVRSDYDASRKALVVVVTDTGPGVPAEESENIFLPFLQLSSEHHSLLGGVGLGLPLSKGLAEALGGALVCENPGDQGRGARFRLVFPALRDKMHASPELVETAHGTIETKHGADALHPSTLVGVSILLAEDSPFIAMYVKRVLEDAGARVEVAENGLLAENAIRSGSYEVALLDLNMPERSGADVVRNLRATQADEDLRGAPSFHAPALIAFTASSPEEAQQAATSAGFDGAICKPVERDALVESILALTRRARARGASLASRDAHSMLM